jgi:tRNA A-37 threonylcarbamoyl transferase component Bud32
MFSIPSDYTLLRPEPGLALIFRQGLLPLLEQAALTRFPTPPQTAAADPGPGAGRAAAWRADLSDGRRLVIKNYRRGGLLGRLRVDRYFGSERQRREIMVCDAAQKAGVRVPVIQCLWVRKAGRFSSRLAAATMEIPAARDLYHALEDARRAAEQRQKLLTAVAVELKKLLDAGIHHPDLNLGNILVTGTAGKDPQIHLIDFDGASIQDGPLGTGERIRALTRMYRSLAKLSLPEPPSLGSDEKELFLDAYWPEHTGSHSALRRRCRRELALHRLWWRLNPTKKDR